MPKRGGLGRGLDALIPTERKKSKNSKSSKRSVTVEKKADDEKKSRKNEGSEEVSLKADESSRKQDDANDTILFDFEAPDMLNEEKKEETRAQNESDTEVLEKEVEQNSIAEHATEDHEKNDLTDSETGENKTGQDGKNDEVVMIRTSLVEPNRDQPRKYFDDAAIEELADSIRQFGIIQPLLVQKKDDYYQIIAGERRWRAAKKCGLKEVPVIVRRFSNQEAVEVALIENIQREDLNPIEEARAYHRLVTEYSLSQEKVAERVSKSRSAVTNSMRLLKLDESIQGMVETGELSEGHARALLALPSLEDQKKLAEQIIHEKLSVRQTEKLIREMLKPSAKKKEPDEKREAMLQTLSEQLKHSLGTKVMIRQNGKNKGKIEIEFYSDEELDRLYELLRSVNV